MCRARSPRGSRSGLSRTPFGARSTRPRRRTQREWRRSASASFSRPGRLGSIPGVEGFDFVHRETVRFRDVDSIGHVNNAVFLTYLEEARIAYLLPFGAE